MLMLGCKEVSPSLLSPLARTLSLSQAPSLSNPLLPFPTNGSGGVFCVG